MRSGRRWCEAGMPKCQVILAQTLNLVLGLSLQLTATLKYKRETSKKCAFCHSGIPEMEDEDPQLNQEGKKFRENGFKLTEEQKKKANARPSLFSTGRSAHPTPVSAR